MKHEKAELYARRAGQYVAVSLFVVGMVAFAVFLLWMVVWMVSVMPWPSWEC